MGNLRDHGDMANRLRDCGDTCEATLIAIIKTLAEPTAVMLGAGWDAQHDFNEKFGGRMVPPTVAYRAMLQAALNELVDPMAQHADTDGLAKLNDTLDGLDLPSRREIQF